MTFIPRLLTLALLALLTFAATAQAAPSTPQQVTNWAYDNSDNGRFQTAATNPKTGAGLAVTYVTDGPSQRWEAIPLNSSGAASGSATTLLTNPNVYQYANPAVEYDPVTGDWVACLGNVTVKEFQCWFLNSDGTVKSGSPFTVSTGATGGGDGWEYYHSISIAYSAKQGKWLAAFGDYYNISTNWFDKDGVVTRGLDLISDNSGDGGLDLAYSPKSDKFMVVGRWRTGGDSQDGAYVWYLNGDGTLNSGPTRVGDGAISYKNPVIAHNAVRDEFMVANFKNNSDLTTQRYKASDGSDVAGEKANALPGTYLGTRNRVAIAAPDYGDSYIATTMLGENPGSGNVYGNYALPLDGTGSLGTIEAIVGPDNVLGSSQRPRVAFNQATCSYLVTYNNRITVPANSWELFSSTLPATDPCNYALTVTKSGTGSGTVSGAGINCGAACSSNETAGSEVTLTATAASGSTFTGWSGACSGTSTCTVTMTEARNVTATFTADNPGPDPDPLTPPKLGIQIDSSKTSLRAGQKLRLQLTADNSGGEAAKNAELCLRIPAGFSLVSGTKPYNLKTRNLVCWALGDLAGTGVTTASSKSVKATLKVSSSARSRSVNLSAAVAAENAANGQVVESTTKTKIKVKAKKRKPKPVTG